MNKIGHQGGVHIKSLIVKYISRNIEISQLFQATYLKVVIKLISQMKQLNTLNISANNCGKEPMEYTCGMKQLSKLSCFKNGIGDEGARVLSQQLKQLTILNICDNDIGDELW